MERRLGHGIFRRIDSSALLVLQARSAGRPRDRADCVGRERAGFFTGRLAGGAAFPSQRGTTLKTPPRNNGGLFKKCTTRIGLLVLLVLVSTPVVGQPIVGHQRKVDIRAHWGYTAVSSRDAPNECACGSQLTTSALGGSVSAAVGAGLRLRHGSAARQLAHLARF